MDMSSNGITDNTLTRNDTGDGDAVYDPGAKCGWTRCGLQPSAEG